jgi:soluble lytic murein transglycosylase
MPTLPSAALAQSRPAAALLIGAVCLGSGVALAATRQLLLQLAPPLTPASSSSTLQWARHLSVDPQRRRDAALLLSAAPERSPAERLRLLKGQGWGPDPLAAAALKQAALTAEASGDTPQAARLWRQLLQRFPQQAASADALYALGRQEPALRQQLRRRFPAHPAALAAAVEAADAEHLARWGPRWPGAEALLLEACRAKTPAKPLNRPQRQQLAGALADLGRPQEALACLGTQARSTGTGTASAALQLNLGRALLQGTSSEAHEGRGLLLALSRRQPSSAEARQAAALLAEEPGPEALAQLSQLPPALQATAAVQARLALEGARPWRAVLQRWPRDPAIWELQWQLARRALLQRQWPQATTLLASLDSRLLPAPLAARQLFWLGFSADRQGERTQAQRHWRQLLQIQPVGYYSWRARQRLGLARLDLEALDLPAGDAPVTPRPQPWQPLQSGDPNLDQLWRTGQWLEAWEHWRHLQGGRAPQSARELLLEGRLRSAIGDDWTGLGQLEQASLRLPQTTCLAQWQREQQQHPWRFAPLVRQAAVRAELPAELLLAVAKQESRFSPAVGSAAGAVGLLQLMPATASELAGSPQSLTQLQDPGRNLQLGARYLQQLLAHWHGDLFLSVASYNAGPGAVQSWLGSNHPDPRREPELWAEAIPYPETRLYTKKVLGNLWSYRLLEQEPEQLCAGIQPR